eukprot:3932706-Rhodomonas_salina.1
MRWMRMGSTRRTSTCTSLSALPTQEPTVSAWVGRYEPTRTCLDRVRGEREHERGSQPYQPRYVHSAVSTEKRSPLGAYVCLAMLIRTHSIYVRYKMWRSTDVRYHTDAAVLMAVPEEASTAGLTRMRLRRSSF